MRSDRDATPRHVHNQPTSCVKRRKCRFRSLSTKVSAKAHLEHRELLHTLHSAFHRVDYNADGGSGILRTPRLVQSCRTVVFVCKTPPQASQQHMGTRGHNQLGRYGMRLVMPEKYRRVTRVPFFLATERSAEITPATNRLCSCKRSRIQSRRESVQRAERGGRSSAQKSVPWRQLEGVDKLQLARL